ncbi:retinoschisin isoform X2 [Nematostella vectensis]|uniref:retinoschisin isoform X2 n=1 Tax=Nematostella vectensis TaxID=45351 RepID=UPI0020777942|nr:retinoschisin isoform X2 [Nematostella vectensis]
MAGSLGLCCLHVFKVALLLWKHASGEDCSSDIFFALGYKLDGHVIETRITTKKNCRQNCHLSNVCSSFNFKHTESRCELNGASFMTHPSQFRPEADSFYALVKLPATCSSGFCGPDKSCVVSTETRGLAYKCKDCQVKPLGMESRAINDSAITASSNYNAWTRAEYGRLNNREEVSNSHHGMWMASRNRAGEYLQVDLGQAVIVTKVATQGRPTTDRWVTSYKIGYSSDLTTWLVYRDDGQEKVFSGNSDRNTIVYGIFEPPILARGIRFVVETFEQMPALRVEIFGCK